jgi:hypothetical protein
MTSLRSRWSSVCLAVDIAGSLGTAASASALGSQYPKRNSCGLVRHNLRRTIKVRHQSSY